MPDGTKAGRLTSSLMIQGTASHVGKSIVAAGLCRLFANEGLNVAPFKSQNMSLNSCVTADGGEIARAQELQARAARVDPTVDMNPLLVKVKDRNSCEVIALGRSIGDYASCSFSRDVRPRALEIITESLDRLRAEHDLLVIEGAGSPAEINLNKLDVSNMQVARLAASPVLLVADIDPGGALAAVVGTLALLNHAERKLIRGIIINKFRGDRELLEPGLTMLEKRTGKRVVGVLPWFDCSYLAEEDTLHETGWRGAEVVVVRLPYTSNFNDFEPLARQVALAWARKPEQLGDARIIIIPGTRNTLNDLEWLKRSGFAEAIKSKAARGAAVIGICGGYQMLGEKLCDPDSIEAQAGEYDGLGLLPLRITFELPKTTHKVLATVERDIGALPGLVGKKLEGYEIHTGQAVVGGAGEVMMFKGNGAEAVSDGACSPGGRVFGTHLHGLFNNPVATAALCRFLGRETVTDDYDLRADESLDELASVIRDNLDMDYLHGLVGL